MKLVPLEQIFEISYGNKLDLYKMEKVQIRNETSVDFVGRSSKNNGVVALVKKKLGLEPYPADCVTVALGGAILSTHLQINPFYTAQNVAVLRSRRRLSELQSLYYCQAIEHNKFRYGAFGREANRTLKNLLVPTYEYVAEYVVQTKIPDVEQYSKSISKDQIRMNSADWNYYNLADLFTIKGTKTTPLSKLREYGFGIYPYVTTQATDNATEDFYNHRTEEGNVLVVDSAVVGYCSYQHADFSASDHVEKLVPKFKLDKYTALFLATIINKEQYRYNYGRKASQTRLGRTAIRLPSKNGKPDWHYMKQFIQSLPYSVAIQK